MPEATGRSVAESAARSRLLLAHSLGLILFIQYSPEFSLQPQDDSVSLFIR